MNSTTHQNRNLGVIAAAGIWLLAVGTGWAIAPFAQSYYIPMPEEHSYQMFETINTATGTNIHNVISISVAATNTVIVYDHFEDGYEADLLNPVQATTRIWGDNNAANGIPPGFATDNLDAGSIIALASTIGVPHNPAANVIYDGQDRFSSTKSVAVTFSCWPVSPGAVLADAIEVYDTTAWGTNYISPVGIDTVPSPDFFDYAGFSIMARELGTVVRIDPDADGDFELTNTLNEGEAWLMDSNLLAGAQIISSEPVQVALLTGDLNSSYEARWFTLTPVEDWCYCGIVPVSTTVNGDPTDVFLYNQYANSFTVDVSLVSGTTSFVVPPKSTYRYRMPSGTGAQMLIRGQNEAAPTLFYNAIAIIDAGDSDNLDHDWGFTVPTLRSLSPQVLVGWGPGADFNSSSYNGSQNGSPVWVVARSNATLYVDYDGDPTTGPLTDTGGNKYNFSTNVLAFQSLRIFDPDGDQTGMRIYALDRTPIAAAWGQDPANSSPGNPYLDMGTTIPALAVFDGSKVYSIASGDGDSRVEPGETLLYTLELINGSFNSIEAITLVDPLPPNVSYVPNSTTVNGSPLADDGSGTAFPLDPPGTTNIPNVASFTNAVVTFQVTLANPFPLTIDTLTNEATFFTADGDLTVNVETPVVQADLELTKTVDNATPFVSSNIVYTISVTNRGPDDAEEVVVEDVLPAGVSYFSHSGSGFVSGSGLWTIGTLPVGDVATLQITATVDAAAVITNVAQVQANGVFDPDSTPDNDDGAPYEDDEDEAVITSSPLIDLELTKEASTLTPSVGDNVVFTLVVTNRGPSTATGVTAVDVLPSGLGYVSDNGSGAYVDGTGIWTIGTLGVGGSVSLQVTASVTNSGSLVNFAQVQTANETDKDSTPGNNAGTSPSEDDEDAVFLTVADAIDLELTKSVNDGTPTVGDTIVYTLVLTNNGPDSATGVTVVDALPAGLSYVTHSGLGTYVPGTGLWTLGGPLTASSGRTLTITALVTASGTRTNVAQVQTAGEYDVDSTPGNAATTPEDDDDSAVIAVVPAADLELTKSVNNSTPDLGDSVTFTVSVTNRGPDNATGVTVEDVLPAGLAYVSDTGAGAFVNGTGVWTIGNLNVGSVTTLQVTASVTASGNIENIAQVETANELDIDSTPGNGLPTEDDQDNATLQVPASGDLELDKSVNDIAPDVGDTIVYTIVVTNRGPDAQQIVSVQDILPAELSYVSHAGGLYDSGSGIWNIGNLNSGSSTTLQITASVDASGAITNGAQIWTALHYDIDSSPSNAPPFVEDDDDFVVINTPPAADLELTKDVNNSTPNVGDSVVFSVLVTNRGPDNATGVAVEDILPAGLAYVSDTGAGAYVNGTGIWTIGNLNVGSVATLQVIATVTNSGNINNIAQVQVADQFDVDSTPDNDVPTEDDQDAASLAVPPAIDLELDKSVNNPTPSVGGTIVYTLVLTNRGPDNATGVTVTDVLPSGMGYVSHVGPGTYVSGTGVWTLGGPMTAGSGRILAITASVTNSGSITNYAQVQTAGEYDIDSTPGNAATLAEDDDDLVVVTVAPSADLELSKNVNNGTPNLGDNVVFTIGVTNRGPNNASGVTVEDVLPAGLAYVSDTGAGDYVNGTGIWTIGALAVGSSTSLQITATVTNSGSIDNIAQVEAANEADVDSTPGNDVPTEDDQDNASLQVPASGDLELDKSVNNAAPNVGDTIVYTVVVTNRGPDAQQTVSVQDVLPSELSYVTHSGGLYDSESGIWNIGSLSAGGSATLQVSALVNASGAVTNYAQIWTALHYDIDSSPSNAPPFVEDDDDFVVINTPAAADLEVLKSVDDGNPNLLGTVVFTVLVTNRGPDNATGVTVEDVIPAGLAYVSDTGAGAYMNGTGIWTIGGLTVGSVTSLQVTATVNNTGLITNIAQVATANEYDIDSTPGNDVPSEDDQDNALVSVGAAADLSLTKSVDDPTPNVGDPIAYTIVLDNDGPDDATGVAVEDVLPTGLSYVSDSGGGDYNTGTDVWTVGGLLNGGSTSLVIQATVDVAGVITNIAQVSLADQYDPDSTPDNDDPREDDQDDAVVDTPQADLELVKSVDNATPNVSENVVFTLLATNRGPDNATSVTVEDILPAGLLYVSDTGGGDYDDSTSIWTIGGLAVGETTNLQVTVTVTNSGLIENIAQIETADQFDVDSTPGNDNPQEDDQDNAVLDVPPATDLELTKTVDNPTPDAGNNVNYTVTVTNRGPDEGEGISVKDVLPAGVSYVSHANGAYTAGSGIWNIGDLAVGATTSLTITVKVDVDGVITNVAEVETSDHFDPDSTPGNEDGTPYEDEEDEAVITASSVIDLELLKTVDKAEANPFENVVWTLVVTNKGPSTATSVTVLDMLPTNWVYVSDSSGDYATNTSIWTLGTLPANSSTSLAITAYATLGITSMGHGPVPPGYTNVAQVLFATEPDIDSTPANGLMAEDDQDDAFIPILALSDLALTKSVDNASPNVGEVIQYTVIVTNEGPQPAVGVLIEDVLPAGLLYVSNSLGSAYSSVSGIWDIGPIFPTQSKTITIAAEVLVTGLITNIAQVNHNEHFDIDSTPDNDLPAEDDQDQVVINGQPVADLELTKSVDNSTPNVTSNVVFTIGVTNRGPQDATGVTVEDLLPSGVAYVSHTGGAYVPGTGIWTIGGLAVGGTTNLQITATVTNSGLIENIAQIEASDQFDSDSTPANDDPQEDDQDNAVLNVPPATDLELTKTVDNATPDAGNNIIYTVTVTNRGPDEGEGISVEDVLPTGVVYVSHTGGSYNSGTGIWNIGDLAVNASTSLLITAQATIDGVFTNVAQVETSDHFDPDSTPGNEDGTPYEDEEDEAVITVTPIIDLKVNKIVDKAQADPFENVTWTIMLTNQGPSTATGVTVYDPLPTNWVYVSDSSGAYDTNTSIWAVGTLPAGTGSNLELVAYATLGVTTMGHGPVPPGYTNIAQVWTATEQDVDSTPANDLPVEDDQDDAFIPIRALSDLALTKTVDDATPFVGQTIQYTVTVTNEGPQPAVGVLVEDILPVGLEYHSNTLGSAYNPMTGIWDIGLILPGASKTITIAAEVNVIGLRTNMAQVNHNEHFDLDSTPDNDNPSEDDQDEVLIDAYLHATIGDYVWLDEDWDGIQDAGEPGIANVRVELLDASLMVIDSTMTDLDGEYLFSHLEPGTYTVRIDTTSVAPQILANPTYDLDGTLDHQTTVTVVSGQILRTADFGYNWAPGPGTGAIGDRVWVDENADGMQGAGEAGIPNVTVNLYVDTAGDGSYSTLLTNTVTDAAGGYIFSGLDTGSFIVQVDVFSLPPNYIQTGDPDTFGTTLPAGTGDHRTTTPVVLAPGDVFVNADFGYWFPDGSDIGDQIYLDANRNGIFDGSDYGIEDVTVVLLDGSGSVIASTITGHPDGKYLFSGLPAGTYTVWVNDTGNVLQNLEQSGDPDGGLDSRSTTTVNGVADDLEQDHGYTPVEDEPEQGLIGDSIFNDRNGNGIPDVGEGIQGVTVSLYDSTGTVLESTTVTDPNGHYYFGGLDAETFLVHVDASTLPNGGTGMVNTVDPDSGIPGDNESLVVLTDGEINLDQDFGYVGLNTIGGTLWKDCNADGILDLDELPRWAGVTVFLRDSDGDVVSSMLTDTNGDYSFGGLADGTYTVDVVDHDNVLNGFWHSIGPVPGNDGNSQLDPYTVSVTGGEVNTTGDFGYYLVIAELGDYVWYDINDNGLQDGGEPGLANVRVRLRISYPNGDEIFMETPTDATGHYVFANLLLDERYNESTLGEPAVDNLPRFEISVTSTQAVLTTEAYEPTLINAGSGSNDARDPDGVFALLRRCGRPVTYDFGYRGGPLLAIIGNVDAFTRDGQAVVRWETLESWDTAGFWLERQVDNEWVRISDTMLPFPIFGVAPIVYEEVDPGAVSGGIYLYRLVEMETDGDLLTYGPYLLTVDGPGRTYEDWAAGHFTPSELADPAISGEEADPDGDGLTNAQEFLAGTDPNVADAILQITGIHSTVDGLEVSWNSIAGRSYRLAISDSIFGPFLPLDAEIIATGTRGSVTLTVGAEARQLYFQVIQVAQE